MSRLFCIMFRKPQERGDFLSIGVHLYYTHGEAFSEGAGAGNRGIFRPGFNRLKPRQNQLLRLLQIQFQPIQKAGMAEPLSHPPFAADRESRSAVPGPSSWVVSRRPPPS